jgi:hypothetical protein
MIIGLEVKAKEQYMNIQILTESSKLFLYLLLLYFHRPSNYFQLQIKFRFLGKDHQPAILQRNYISKAQGQTLHYPLYFKKPNNF